MSDSSNETEKRIDSGLARRGGNPRIAEVGIATRFKPGTTLNPAGRPKSAPLSRAIRAVLGDPYPGDPQHRTYAQIIALRLAEKAAKGDVKAAAEIWDRAEGKARQTLTIEMEQVAARFEKLSAQELEEYVRTGVLPAEPRELPPAPSEIIEDAAFSDMPAKEEGEKL